MARNVKGSLFIDPVRMLKSGKDIDWSEHLSPTDMTYLDEKINPDSWYPLDVFERMGLAAFKVIGKSDLEAVRHWGRFQMDDLIHAYKDVIEEGNPVESLMRFQVLRHSLFDFDAINVVSTRTNRARFEVYFDMTREGEEASVYQTMGFFERIVELSGGKKVRGSIISRSWEGDDSTVIELNWE